MAEPRTARRFCTATAGFLLVFTVAAQEHAGHAGHRMSADATGMTMNANPDVLPRDCDRVAGEVHVEVRAGQRYAEDFPGAMFGYNEREWQAPPCSRVTITLVNDDEVRHQWMLHGLPRYLYSGGMFHLEVAGGAQRTASFIVPSDDRTYLVHCDLTQHMEKGMKAQLKVGRGSGDLWSIPGISGDLEPFADIQARDWRASALAFTVTLILSLIAWRQWRDSDG